MSDALRPALELAQSVSRPYPNDSEEYRKARTALLAEEIELRRHSERVAAQRRALPPGGPVRQDYVFTNEAGRKVRLSELFGDSPTLVTYTWMYGPKRARPCPMCTSMLSALDGEARDIEQRVPLAIFGTSPIERQMAFKKERGWRNLKFYADDTLEYVRDYRCLGPNGEDWPNFNVFTQDAAGLVRHFYGAEMGGTEDPGQDPRGAPEIMPLWIVLDLTPEGRAPDWYPSLDYPSR